MKHLLKIIFSAILCMAVSLTAVFICLKSGGVTGSESVKITAENGGKVEYGVYEQPNFAGVNFKSMQASFITMFKNSLNISIIVL